MSFDTLHRKPPALAVGMFTVPGCMKQGYAPNVETMEAIQEDFGIIAVKLNLLSDVLNMVEKSAKLTTLNIAMAMGD